MGVDQLTLRSTQKLFLPVDATPFVYRPEKDMLGERDKGKVEVELMSDTFSLRLVMTNGQYEQLKQEMNRFEELSAPMDGWTEERSNKVHFWTKEISLDKGVVVAKIFLFPCASKGRYKVSVGSQNLEYTDAFNTLEDAMEQSTKMINTIKEIVDAKD